MPSSQRDEPLIRISKWGPRIPEPSAAPLTAAPLKIYLMSGQSNMQGFCAVHTFPQIEADPVTKPIYEKMVNPDGTPRVHKDVPGLIN